MNHIKLLPLGGLRETSHFFPLNRGTERVSHLFLPSGRLRGGLFMLAQTNNLTTYDVVAKSGNVSIIVKDNDYHMIVGSTKKPKLNMTMGYSKEHAMSFIDYILDFSNDDYTKKNRNVSMYGMMFFLTITGQGENEGMLYQDAGRICGS